MEASLRPGSLANLFIFDFSPQKSTFPSKNAIRAPLHSCLHCQKALRKLCKTPQPKQPKHIDTEPTLRWRLLCVVLDTLLWGAATRHLTAVVMRGEEQLDVALTRRPANQVRVSMDVGS